MTDHKKTPAKDETRYISMHNHHLELGEIDKTIFESDYKIKKGHTTLVQSNAKLDKKFKKLEKKLNQ